MIDIDAIRKIFPHTKKTAYFNCASTGPFSDTAYAIQDKYFNTARMAEVGNQSEVFTALENIRRNGARIFGCRKSEVGYGFNTTFGLNLAAFGLPLVRGDEVVLCDVEFPANVYPWLELQNRGIRVKFIKSIDGFFDIGNLEKAITKKTRVLAVSFVQYFNGYKIDIDAVADICRKRNIYLVLDCIQAAGCEPMNVRKWNAAVASAGGQKWLLSPQGTGLYYVSEEMQQRIRPPWRSWLGVDWKCQWHDLQKFDLDYADAASQYELGTYPGPLVLAFDWAVNYIVGLGIRNIQKHNHMLLDRLIYYLKSQPLYRITSALKNKHRSSILSFTSDQLGVKSIHRHLLRHKIITSLREGSLRVAVHLYNDKSDIDRLIAGLDEAAGRAIKGNSDL